MSTINFIRMLQNIVSNTSEYEQFCDFVMNRNTAGPKCPELQSFLCVHPRFFCVMDPIWIPSFLSFTEYFISEQLMRLLEISVMIRAMVLF
jgi:hypothetical protein